MLNNAFIKLALAAAIGLVPYRAGVEAPDRIFQNTQNPAVVYIESAVGACTGAVIGEDLVLTAAHCVEGVRVLGVRFEQDGGFVWSRFHVIYAGIPGSDHDIAILKGNTLGTAPMELAASLPTAPTACYFYGYAGTDSEMQMPCFVLENVGVLGSMGLGQSRPGDSGGPVVGSDGKIIGVVWGGLIADPNVFIIAPVDAVRLALERL